MARAKAFIQANCEQPITLDQVAAHVHVSRFYFCKLFRKATGLTLTEYIARVRLEKAKSLLSDPSLRISEIVFAAGFGSIPQFNSVFKQIVGVSPTDYRDGASGPKAGERLITLASPEKEANRPAAKAKRQVAEYLAIAYTSLS